MRMRVIGILFLLCASLLSACGGGSSSGGNPPPGNPVPSVGSLTPASGLVGGVAFTLTVNGANFVSGSVVQWNGNPLTTTFGSSTSLTAAVPASVLSATGSAIIAVVNPAPGGGTSASTTFGINNPAPVVATLSQTAADAGSPQFTLTVNGSGFVANSVVQWNGSARTTSFGSGTHLTATITAVDLAFAGSVQVAVSNAAPGGGNSAAVGFDIRAAIAHGVALPGADSAPAINATTDLRESNPASAVIVDNVVMNRLDVRFARNATVGQVNTAIGSVGGGIVSMSQGLTSVTIAIPVQGTYGELQALAAHLKAAIGVHLVKIATFTEPEVTFEDQDFDFSHIVLQMSQLVPERFPAAWNVARTRDFGDPKTGGVRPCGTSASTLVMDDVFPTPLDSGFTKYFQSIPEPDALPANTPANTFTGHGLATTEVAAARGFGANAFSATSGCVNVTPVQLSAGGNSANEETDYLVAHMPAGRFVVNFSVGAGSNCSPSPCEPPDAPGVRGPLARADDALYWKEKTRDRWGDFLVVASAGNYRDKLISTIYPGMSDARFNSKMTIAQQDDPLFEFVNEDAYWTPTGASAAAGFVSIKPTAQEYSFLAQDIVDAGLRGPDAVADNVIVVGSATAQPAVLLTSQRVKQESLSLSSFSGSGADVLAVGEHALGALDLGGTSFAAPQVAGLVTYLWMLSPDLRNNQPVAVTKRAIVANARNHIIDAYASVLSLDAEGAPTPQGSPMRLKLLDLNEDDKFDEQDVDTFLLQYFVTDNNGDLTDVPRQAVLSFSRYDLNGDGFTGGDSKDSFDLDRSGSTQYGESVYTTVLQNIGGDVSFNESNVTDLEILCYYAYSALYSGTDDTVRDDLLGSRCTPVTITIDPGLATLQPGGTQQFAATVHGLSDPRVTWTVTGGSNSIDASGIVTAGLAPGSFVVRASSVADPSAFGEATLVVTSVDCSAAFQGPHQHSLTSNLVAPPLIKRGGASSGPFTDSLDTAIAQTSVTMSYGSLASIASDSDTGNFTGNLVNGGLSVNALSSAEATLGDDFIVVPVDPSLNGTPMTLTLTASASVSMQLSGDRAKGRVDIALALPFSVARFVFIRSTLPGSATDDPAPVTLTSTTSDYRLGDMLRFSADALAATAYACDAFPAPCPPAVAAGTGTARVTANLSNIRFTVRGQSGDPVASTVCSSSGANYQ